MTRTFLQEIYVIRFSDLVHVNLEGKHVALLCYQYIILVSGIFPN